MNWRDAMRCSSLRMIHRRATLDQGEPAYVNGWGAAHAPTTYRAHDRRMNPVMIALVELYDDWEPHQPFDPVTMIGQLEAPRWIL